MAEAGGGVAHVPWPPSRAAPAGRVRLKFLSKDIQLRRMSVGRGQDVLRWFGWAPH